MALVTLVRRGQKGWEVLLTKRLPDADTVGFLELPGGKLVPSGGGEEAGAVKGEDRHGGGDDVQPPESPGQAACREVHEELGLLVCADRLEVCGSSTHSYPDRVIRFYLFVLRQLTNSDVGIGRITCDHAWARVDQLDQWNLPPANVVISQMLAGCLVEP